MRDFVLAISSTMLNGLPIKSSAPASIPLILAPVSCMPVTMITGMSRNASSSFNRRQTSKPFMSGIKTSSMIRSTSAFLARYKASLPFSALYTS